MKKRNKKRVTDAIEAYAQHNKGEIKSDVLGSYTGTGQKDQKPEQDADDL